VIDPKRTVSYHDYLSKLLSIGDHSDLPNGVFFDGQSFANKVAYVSYSRSGNTFFRKLLEQVTGVFTGSDNLPEIGLSYQLQHVGFTGEGIYDDHVWFVKSHYPIGKDEFFTADKAICCVRNPLDVVPSLFNMWIGQT
jgi:hypothetical protein